MGIMSKRNAGRAKLTLGLIAVAITVGRWTGCAELGDAGTYNLGVMYYEGQEVPQDYREAAKWFRKAAAQGLAKAQHNLGVMYYEGQGVPQDNREAAKWFRKADARGDARAQHNLGVMYYNGLGVPQDHREAVKWYRKAAAQGYAAAQNNLGVMYYNGLGVPQDHREAVKWYRKAAAQGYAVAQNNLSWMHHNSIGVPQDYREAAKWTRKAAARGDAAAQYNLGEMYRKGEGVPQDVHDWLKRYRKAAEQGDAEAQNSLGLMYASGTGVPQDYREAAKWTRKAAEQGLAEAQYGLGYMYAEGEGVPQDFLQAHAWMNLAAGQGDKRAAELRDRVATRMTPAQVFEAQQLAAELRDRIEADTNGRGRGLTGTKPQSRHAAPTAPGPAAIERPRRSRQELQEAARRGAAVATGRVGQMYATGQGVPQDLIEATTNSLPKLPSAKPKVNQRPRLSPAPSAEQDSKAHQDVKRRVKEGSVVTTLPEPTGRRALYRKVTPPTVLSRIKPVYSERARKAKLEGTVELSAIVRKNGSIEAVKVLRGLGLGLDESAVRALKSWQFRPGMKNGRPVDLRINIEVTFGLRSPP